MKGAFERRTCASHVIGVEAQKSLKGLGEYPIVCFLKGGTWSPPIFLGPPPPESRLMVVFSPVEGGRRHQGTPISILQKMTLKIYFRHIVLEGVSRGEALSCLLRSADLFLK